MNFGGGGGEAETFRPQQMSMSTLHAPTIATPPSSYLTINLPRDAYHKGQYTDESQKQVWGENLKWVAPSLATEEWLKHCAFLRYQENDTHSYSMCLENTLITCP